MSELSTFQRTAQDALARNLTINLCSFWGNVGTGRYGFFYSFGEILLVGMDQAVKRTVCGREFVKSLLSSVFLPIGAGENAYSDEVLQLGLDFVRVVCSNSGKGLRMHHERGAGQKAPPASHLTVFLQVVGL